MTQGTTLGNGVWPCVQLCGCSDNIPAQTCNAKSAPAWQPDCFYLHDSSIRPGTLTSRC